MKPNICYFILAFVSMIGVMEKKNRKAIKAVSAVPFILSLAFGMLSPLTIQIFPMINLTNALTKTGTNITLTSVGTWIPDLLLLFTGSCLLISVWFSFEEKRHSLFSCLILLIGFASRMIMGFSPTIWASLGRTFYFMYITIICVSVYILAKTKDTKLFFQDNKMLCYGTSSFVLLCIVDEVLKNFI